MTCPHCVELALKVRELERKKESASVRPYGFAAELARSRARSKRLAVTLRQECKLTKAQRKKIRELELALYRAKRSENLARMTLAHLKRRSRAHLRRVIVAATRPPRV